MTSERLISAGEQDKVFNVEYDQDGPGYGLLKIKSSEELRQIPVFSAPNPNHHKLIARAIASGSPIVFEVGVMGLLLAVKDPRGGDDNWHRFWQIKRGRVPEEKSL